MMGNIDHGLRELFGEALDCDTPEALQEFLDGRCAGQPAMRERLETLLEAHHASGRFMKDLDRQTGPDQEIPPPGAIIDRFRIIGPVGEGGFGVVYLAEQFEPVVRQVAIKVIRPGMHTGLILARFHAERQTLALMDHPGIAQIYDGGQTACGHPYVVMELVQGLPITDYCDAERLSIESRIRLFQEVCNAVQHAHQKGIIHCDLKPSNIIVADRDGERVAKVIDFGIARALKPVPEQRGSAAGENASIQGSPNYMSPEQWPSSGLDVDSRSDIYSLGVLLYELLAGVTPFQRKEWAATPWSDLSRRFASERPSPPSQHFAAHAPHAGSRAEARGSRARALRRTLRRDLDWIVLRALEADRERRYGSVAAMADDLQRSLHGDVVQAVPRSTSYRVNRFLRRNRAVLVPLLIVIGTLAATSVFSIRAANTAQRAEKLANRRFLREQLATSQAQQATLAALEAQEKADSQRQRAEANLHHARQIVGRISTQLLSADPEAAGEVARLRQAILLDTLDFFQQCLEANSGDPRLRRDMAKNLLDIGNVQQGLLAWNEAQDAFRKSVRIMEVLCAEQPDEAGNQRQLALARLALARNLRMSGQKLLEAESLYRDALAGFGPQDATDSIPPEDLEFAIENFAEFGHFLAFTRGQRRDAEPYLLRSAALSENIREPGPANLFLLARVYNSLGILYRQSLESERAVPLHRESIRLLENAIRLEKLDAAPNELARSYAHLALATIATGSLDEAETDLRRAIEIRARRLDDFPKDRTARIELSLNGAHLAGVLEGSNRWIEAADWLQRSIQLLAELSPGSPHDVSVSHHYLDLRRRMANLMHLQGKTQEAIPIFEELKQSSIPSAAAANVIAWHLANCPVPEQRDYARAMQLAATATEQNPTEGIYWATLGCARFRAGDLPGARQALERSATLVADSYDSVPGFLLALVHQEQGEFEQAKRIYEQARARFQRHRTWVPEDDQIAAEARERMEPLGGHTARR